MKEYIWNGCHTENKCFSKIKQLKKSFLFLFYITRDLKVNTGDAKGSNQEGGGYFEKREKTSNKVQSKSVRFKRQRSCHLSLRKTFSLFFAGTYERTKTGFYR